MSGTTNFGFYHVALATTDHEASRRFFQDGLKMKCARNDEHLLVLTTGINALFFFKTKLGQPLSAGPAIVGAPCWLRGG